MKKLFFIPFLFAFINLTAQGVSIDCDAIYQKGVHEQGLELSSWLSNRLFVDLNVTAPGTYTLSTDTVNGAYYSITLNATSSGLYELAEFQGYGTPINQGTHTYSLMGCSFDVYTNDSLCNFYQPTINYSNVECGDDSSSYISVRENDHTGLAPYTYDWVSPTYGESLPDSFFIDNLTAGIYFGTVTDARGCTYGLDIRPNPQPGVLLDVPQTHYQICAGDSVELCAYNEVWKYYIQWFDNPNGDGPYLSTSGASDYENCMMVAPQTTTSYYVYEFHGCLSQPVEVVVEVLDYPTTPVSTQTNTSLDTFEICAGETIDLDLSCNGEIHWFNNPVASGTPIHVGSSYSITPSQNQTLYAFCFNGTCYSEAYYQAEIIVNPVIETPIAQESYEICNGDSVWLTADHVLGSGVVFWYASNDQNTTSLGMDSILVHPSSTTNYYAFAQVGNCSSDAALVVTVEVTNYSADVVGDAAYEICPGDSVTLSANSIIGVTWFDDQGNMVGQGNDITIAPSASTFFVAMADNGSCLSNDGALQVDVTVTDVPTDLTMVNEFTFTVCEGDQFDINSNGVLGSGLVWMDGVDPNTANTLSTSDILSVSPGSNQTYYAFQHDGNCFLGGYYVVNIVVDPIPSVPSGNTSYTICKNSAIEMTLTSDAGCTLEWYDNAAGNGTPVFVGNTFNYTDAIPTTFYVFTTCNSQCISAPTEVTVNVVLTPFIEADTVQETICAGNTITLSGNANGMIYWYDNPNASGSPVYTGNNLTITPTSTMQLYGFTVTGSCISDEFILYQVTLLNTPGEPTVPQTNFEICAGSCLDMTAYGQNGGLICWFDNPDGTGVPLFIGNIYNICPTQDTTFWVIDELGNGCMSDPIQVNVVVNPTPSMVSGVYDYDVCAGESVNLMVPGSNGVLHWFTSPSTNSTPVFTGQTYSQTNVSTNATYYVFAYGGSCYSDNYAQVNLNVSSGGDTPTGQTVYNICAGDQTVISALSSNSSMIEWYTNPTGSGSPVFVGSTFTISPSTTTTYYAFTPVNGSGTCAQAPLVVQVNVDPAPFIQPELIETTVCEGSTVVIGGTSNGTISWYTQPNPTGNPVYTGNNIPVVPTSSTTYYGYTGSGACMSNDYVEFDVTVLNAPDVPVINQTNYEVCANSCVNMTATSQSGGLICWFDDPNATTPIYIGSTYTICPSQDGTFWVRDELGNGCMSPAIEVNVEVSPAPSISSSTYNSLVCAGESAYLTVPGATGSLHWFTSPSNNGTPVFVGNPYIVNNVSASQTYYVFASNGDCYSPNYAQVNLNAGSGGDTPSGQTQYQTCGGQQVTLTASSSNSSSIEWYTNSAGTGTPIGTGSSIVVSPSSSTTYYAFTPGSSANCQGAPLAVNVQVSPAPFLAKDTLEFRPCHNEMITLTANTPYTVEWHTSMYPNANTLVGVGNPFAFDPQPTTNAPIETIFYYGFATNGSCYSDNFICVKVIHLGELDPPVGQTEYTICEDECVTMTATSTTIGSICWFDYPNPTPGQGGPLMIGDDFTVCPDQTTTYYVFDEYSTGCMSDYVAVTVYVEDCTAPNMTEPRNPGVIGSPVQVFSPNNDGFEDIMFIGGPQMKNYHVEIYNMSGQLVKMINNYQDGWDGRDMSGEIQPNGYYVYSLEADGVIERRIIGVIK